MICTNCGAPVAIGSTECPYCHAKIGPQSSVQSGEETTFAGSDVNEYAVENEGATEFAGAPQMPVMQPEAEETEFAPPVHAEIPTPPVRKVPREKTQARKQKPQKQKKQRKHKDEENTAEKADKKTMLIRGVLIAVLVVLIVAAFLR
ncbi:hypothetical protein [uncultured Gemmiger sp.]|uniref:hypothetical protein n=1 Tax=uncultured Gemmiger sp. TaxID=1623490 RepID=UPI0025FA0A97|nr:hypothetical protein [uncultured Gemmiger sp.]